MGLQCTVHLILLKMIVETDRTCSIYGKAAFMNSVGNPEGNRAPGLPRCRSEDNIKIDCTEIEWECKLDSAGIQVDG
jgi:hypothetical protein